MPATILDDVAHNTSQPSGMLPYQQNCVAMAFSRVLGVNVHVTINFFLSKGWIARASDLQNDRVILTIVEALGLSQVCSNQSLDGARTEIQKKADGRFFAVNSGVNAFNTSDSIGHAFAIIKHAKPRPTDGSKPPQRKGALGIVGNNSDKTDAPYQQAIKSSHKISVWGPVAWTPYFGSGSA